MRLCIVLAAVMAFWWPQPASATQSFCYREPSGWWNPMLAELPDSMNRIRLTRRGIFWNGTRVNPAELRERLRNVRAMQRPIFTLLEYEDAVGCPAIDRLRDTVSSALACSEELCGETMVGGYYRPPSGRQVRRTLDAIRRANEDIRRAQAQAKRALDATELANEPEPRESSPQ